MEKVVRLGEMAGDIVRHPFLCNVLALKGGTALIPFFGPPKRLSVDLDFNYMGHRDREKMLTDRPRVEQAVIELGRHKDCISNSQGTLFAGRKIYLVYRSVLGLEERIELDLNFLFRVPIAGTEQGKLWQPGELDRPEVRTVSLQEIITGKMLAMLDRSASRDVWDLVNLPTSANHVMELPSFRNWFIALAAILNHPLPTYTLIRLKDRVTEHAVLEKLAPMLAMDTKPRADDLVKQAWRVLSEFTTLTPNEPTYIASIEQGELRPELLFPDDPKTAHRKAEHPAIQWKVKNVRSHLAQRAKTHTKK